MPFKIVRDRITSIHADAIVSSTNTIPPGHNIAGIAGEIFFVAGPELRKAYEELGGCETGKAKATDGYNLPCRYVIHTSAPVWCGGNIGDKELLISCYEESLRLCESLGCESIAFPLISSGSHDYSEEPVVRTATETIEKYLESHDLTVYLVIPYPIFYPFTKELGDRINDFIGQHRGSVPPELLHKPLSASPFRHGSHNIQPEDLDDLLQVKDKTEPADKQSSPYSTPASGTDDFLQIDDMPVLMDSSPSGAGAPVFGANDSLWDSDTPEQMDFRPGKHNFDPPSAGLQEHLEKYRDESFRDMLLRKIDEKNITDTECYRKANIDRKLFNKIKNQANYHPGKPTVLALAIALQLPLEETQEMLHKAGYYLSHSAVFDLIVEYFILERNYNIYAINEALFHYDQRLLGSMA